MKRQRFLGIIYLLLAMTLIGFLNNCEGERGPEGPPGPPGECDYSITDQKYVNIGEPDSITSDMIVNGSITDADVDLSKIQKRVTGVCGSGYAIKQINQDGTVICEPVSGGGDADKVDGFDASSTPQPNTLLALDNNGKIPNSALYTGSGNGLDADMLDGKHASEFLTQETDTLDTVVSRGNISSHRIEINTQNGTGLQVYSRATAVRIENTGDNDNWPLVVYGNGPALFISKREGDNEALEIRSYHQDSANRALEVWGRSTFRGDVTITGTLTKSAGAFVIDHPLDPKNKILRHSFVESREMLNIYKGRAKLLDGSTVITLPDYFEKLNRKDEVEFILTPINGWSPLYVDGEIVDNQFVVRTTPEGNPNQEFSWVVLGVRNDPYARNHPIIVEEEKGVNNDYIKGECIHPEACEEVE